MKSQTCAAGAASGERTVVAGETAVGRLTAASVGVGVWHRPGGRPAGVDFARLFVRRKVTAGFPISRLQCPDGGVSGKSVGQRMPRRLSPPAGICKRRSPRISTRHSRGESAGSRRIGKRYATTQDLSDKRVSSQLSRGLEFNRLCDRTHTMPWAQMVLSIGLSQILFLAALKLSRTREY